jgi:hypothetical protein
VRFATLHAVPLAGGLKRIGREVGAEVDEHVGDSEVKGAERVHEGRYRETLASLPLTAKCT